MCLEIILLTFAHVHLPKCVFHLFYPNIICIPWPFWEVSVKPEDCFLSLTILWVWILIRIHIKLQISLHIWVVIFWRSFVTERLESWVWFLGFTRLIFWNNDLLFEKVLYWKTRRSIIDEFDFFILSFVGYA